MDERELFERHAERVMQFFVNKVRRPSDASDLAQETFVRCFERLRRGDVDHPRAFLFGVANFVLREYWSAKGRRQDDVEVGNLSVAELGAPPNTTLGSLVARKQGQLRMLEAMRQLRLDYQNVLELRYWHDLKYDEIAEVLGQNEKTIGVWLRRAKDDLRRILEGTAGPRQARDEPFEPRALDRWLREAGDTAAASIADTGPGS
ncbi:RNA polymerase sigma factor [Paraliomyxa miuraensis]|uniref:RNA polymerase sigma factor n=1 Tax=Paraliomyxa miuraensis TaxID=376150 RepID=UPI002259F689|nr:sigma-70 family RNA polymerase sigma factor [Paraliomyxa miuraensis]MCX4247503.1 sigma-70 family RNA polymerase sigma factor [Paraliomyxa miuraensis]